jgi:hypothetical protein
MRFKDYLKEQEEKYSYPHASPTSKEEVVEWIKQHSKAHVAGLLRGGPIIWRGLSMGREDHPYGLGDTSKFVRKAANTSNFINLLVSRSSKWKDYPKRESAYICTTDLDNANNFGDPYLVIPADDAGIGVVPAFDFWCGFKEFDKMFKGGGVEMMNEVLSAICQRFGEPIDNSTDYAELTRILRSIWREDLEDMIGDHPDTNKDFHDMSDKIHVDFHNEYSRRIKMIAEKMDYRESMLTFLEGLLDPAASGFTHTKGETFHVEGDHEVWIGGTCAFISISEFVDEYDYESAEKKVREWLNAL